MGELMKKIIKRIICYILVTAITIVSFGSVVNAEETDEAVYSAMYKVKTDFRKTQAEQVKNTPYNDETIPNNFSVESKEITGNEKHFLTWDNSNVLNYTKYKVEVYCVLYMEYRKIDENEDRDLTEIDLENTPWEEYPFPAIHCVDVDASDCGTVINFSDIEATLKDDNIWVHDPVNDPDDDYEEVLKFYNKIEETLSKKLNIDFNYMGDKLNRYNRFSYEMSYIPDSMKYLRFGRVKYFARYVSKQAIDTTLKPDADGYYHYYLNTKVWQYNKGKSNYNVNYVNYMFKSRKRLWLYISGTSLRGPIVGGTDYFMTADARLAYDFDRSAASNVSSGVLYFFENTNPQIQLSNIFNSKLIFTQQDLKLSNDPFCHDLVCDAFNIDNERSIPVDSYFIDSNFPAVVDRYGIYTDDAKKEKEALINWLDNGNYNYNQVTVGKFVENDSQIIKPRPKPTNTPAPDPTDTPDPAKTQEPASTSSPTSSPTTSPDATTAPLPTELPKPGTDNKYTDMSDSDTDVVHWLKMIYNRCGKLLEQIKVINTVVEKLNDIIDNQKKLITGYSNQDDYGDVVKYLKKIYNIIYTNSLVDDLTDSIEDYISGVGNGVLTAASAACDTASKTFPFSIVFVPKLVLDALSAEPKTPYKQVKIKVDKKQVGNIEFPGYDFSFTIDLTEFNDVAAMFREVSIIIFLCGMVKHTVDVIALMKDGVE